MKLDEILSNIHQYDVVTDTANKFKTRALINGRHIECVFVRDESQSDTWDFEFTEDTDSGKTTKETGSGGEFKVLSVVLSSLLEFIDRYEPSTVQFTADGTQRIKLYTKILNKLITTEKRGTIDISHHNDSALFKLTL